MPRPGSLEQARQLSVGDAGKRVSHSGTGRDVGKIPQGPEGYPEWLRYRVIPPQGDSMPLFLLFSTSA